MVVPDTSKKVILKMRLTKETLKTAGLPNDAALDLAIAMDNIHKTLCRLDMNNRRAIVDEFGALFAIGEQFGRAEDLNADLVPEPARVVLRGFKDPEVIEAPTQ